MLYWWRESDRSARSFVLPVLSAGLGFVAASLLLNPYFVLKPTAVVDDIQFIFGERYTNVGTVAMPLGKSFRFNTNMAVIMMRPYLMITAAIATVVMAWQRKLDLLLVPLFMVVFVVSMGPANRPDITHLLPAAVPAVLLTAYLLEAMIASQRQPVFLAGWLATTGLIGIAAFQSIHLDRILTQPNTRTQAQTFITENIPAGSRILIGNTFSFSVPLTPNQQSLERMDSVTNLPISFTYLLDHPEDIPQPAYDLFSTEYQDAIGSAAEMREFIVDQNIEYIVVADYCGGTGDLYEEAGSADFPYIGPDLAGDLILQRTFTPFHEPTCDRFIDMRLPLRDLDLDRWVRPGPIVRIYEVPPELD
jgi:hypothetical protein